MKTKIQGEWKTGRVHIDGEELLGPGGMRAFPYVWGSDSDECAVLALTILVRCCSDRAIGWKLLEAFNREIIAQLPQMDFKIELDLGEWLEKQSHHRDTEDTENIVEGEGRLRVGGVD